MYFLIPIIAATASVIAASTLIVLVLWFATQSDLPDSEGF